LTATRVGTRIYSAADTEFRAPPPSRVITVKIEKPEEKANRRPAVLFLTLIAASAIYFYIREHESIIHPPAPSAVSAIASNSSAPDTGASLALTPSTAHALLQNEIRPKDWLKKYEAAAGKKTQFADLSKLHLQPAGKPITLQILLNTPINRETEERWRAAKILRAESPSGLPYIRSVTISGKEDWDQLLDWRIEGAAVQ